MNIRDVEKQLEGMIPVINRPSENVPELLVDRFEGPDTEKIMQALDKARQLKGARLVFSPRTYCVHSLNKEPIHTTYTYEGEITHPHLVINETDDLIFDGNGCTIEFSDLAGGMRFGNCHRVLIRNMEFDWKMLMSSSGWIQTRDGHQYVDIDPKYSDAPNLPIREICEYDTVKRAWYNCYRGGGTIFGHRRVGDYCWQFSDDKRLQSCLEDGTHVLIRHNVYMKECINMYDCSDMTIENVTLVQSPAMGILVAGGGRGFHINGLKFIRKRREQLLTCMADGLHISTTCGDILVENCLFQHQGDDGIAFSTLKTRVKKVEGNTIVVKYPPMDVYESDLMPTIYVAGDRIALCREGMEKVGEAIVQSVKVEGTTYRINIDKIGDYEIEPHMFCLNMNRRPENVLIRNNVFRRHRCRGMHTCGKNVVIEHNIFEDLQNAAIMVTEDTFDFYLGYFPENYLIRHNRFTRTSNDIINPRVRSSSGAVVVINSICGDNVPDETNRKKYEERIWPEPSCFSPLQVIKNIIVKGNHFDTSPQMAILATSTDGLLIENNTIENVGYCRDKKDGEALHVSFDGEITILQSCRNVIVQDNEFVDMNSPYQNVYCE